MPPRPVASTAAPARAPLNDAKMSVTSVSRQPREGADHRQHLHVAHAQPVDAPQPVIRLANRPEHAAAQHQPRSDSRHPGGRNRLRAKPIGMPVTVITLGRMRCWEVDDEEHDHRAAERDADERERRHAVQQTGAGEERPP
jgi:hypothetical protein